MPDVIDERWEFWTPDPEIVEAMAGERSVGFGGLPRSVCSATGRFCAAGFRFGKGSPDSDPLRVAPAKWQRPDRLPLRRCRDCTRYFTPTNRSQVYCSRSCFTDGVSLDPMPCKRCGVVFKPCNAKRVYCSVSCHAASRFGLPKRLRWDAIAAAYQSGGRVADIAAAEAASRAAVRTALKRAGVYRGPGKSGPLRTVPDAACKTCGAVFRPHQRGQASYCSRPCAAASHKLKPINCAWCGATFTPRRSRFKFCGYRCSGPAARAGRKIDAAEAVRLHAAGLTPGQIAGRVGYAAVSVRAVLRQHKHRGATGEHEQNQPRHADHGAGRPRVPGVPADDFEVDRLGEDQGLPVAGQQRPAGHAG